MTNDPNERAIEAAKKNDLPTVKQLIESGAVPSNVTNPAHLTLAHIAAKKGYFQMVKYLLEEDPSLFNVTNPWDETLLQLAVEGGSLPLVKLLVEDYNAEVEKPPTETFGYSAIHVAAQTGHLDIFKYFVEERKADINYDTGMKQPTAFTAALYARLNIVRYIVEECKADVCVIDSIGGNILYKSARKGDITVPKYLLDERKLKFDINHRDSFGETIVHRASRLNHAEFVKYFVEEKRADITIRDNAGSTPLHLAVKANCPIIVELLIKNGANLTLKDNGGNTPLKVARHGSMIEYLEKITEKRIRRHAPLFVESVAPLSNSVFGEWQHRAIEGPSSTLAVRSQFFEVDSHRVDSFLTLVSSAFRRVAQHRRPMLSPGEIIRSRIDPVAIDAVHDLS